MHTLFGITLVLYLLKLSAGKGFCNATAFANYSGPCIHIYSTDKHIKLEADKRIERRIIPKYAVADRITTAHSRIYLHFEIPSKQLHWLDFILLKFITYDIVIKLF